MGVLDDMTKGITQRKADAAGPTLTPVGVEASPTKPSLVVPGALFPNDQPIEVVQQALIDLRRIIAHLQEAEEAMVAMTGEQTKEDKAAQKAKQKAAEKAADARVETAQSSEFATNMRKLQAEAQAAVFTVSDAGAEEPEAPEQSAAGGWECPDHGSKAIKQTTSRAGRTYSLCDVASCEQFER